MKLRNTFVEQSEIRGDRTKQRFLLWKSLWLQKHCACLLLYRHGSKLEYEVVMRFSLAYGRGRRGRG